MSYNAEKHNYSVAGCVMDKNNLISFFRFKKFSFEHIFSGGPEMYFKRPCIGYIKKGSAKFLHNGKTIYAHEGDLIYIPFETKYQSIWFGSPEVEWYSAEFDFNLKHSFSSYRFQILREYPSYLFEKMFESYNESYYLAVSYFYQLLNDVYGKMKSTPTTSAYLKIEPAINYIEANYMNPISIDELAKLCNISKSAFFKSFKNIIKVTPIEYKHNIMIQHAIDLITNTNKSIEEISSTVGFPSSNYFRKVFLKFTNKSPKDLRKK